MSETICLLCKTTINTAKYNIDKDCTKYSNLLLRTILEGVFEHKVILTPDLHVCTGCVDLLNELDLAESTYKRIRQKVFDYLSFNTADAFSKSNVYCQTDVFMENVFKFDVRGETKSTDAETKSLVSMDLNKTCDNTSSEELSNHKGDDLGKKHQCHVCFKRFASKSGAALHVKRQHSVKCEQELLEFSNEEKFSDLIVKDEADDFDLGVTVNHSDVDRESDDQPDKPRKSRRGNRGRKKRYPGVLKPYKCTMCPKTWKTLGELKSHLSAHSDARPFICEVCGQAYKHKTALDIHVGMHNGICPFMCMYCKKSFTQKGALQRHLPIHTGETPYQCDLCGKRFVHHTSFNIHQLSHSGQKDYKCAQCGLALLSGSHLKRHMRVHTGERNYACPFCGKRFAERYNLASHQKLHENPRASAAFKRNHRCQICQITFNRRLTLDEHMAKDHQKISDTDVPFIQQMFTKNETDSLWTTSYNGLKTSVPETASY